MTETNWGGILGTVLVAGVALHMVDKMCDKKCYRLENKNKSKKRKITVNRRKTAGGLNWATRY